MKKIFYGLIFVLLFHHSLAQNWIKVGGGVNDDVYCLFADTTNNLLYAGGWLTQAGEVNANHIAVWNGISWNSMGNGTAWNSRVWAINKYHDSIYSSSLYFGPTDYNFIAKWNGISWDSLGWGINDAAPALTVYNDTLYVGGVFNKAGGINTTLLAKYDGTNWYGYPFHLEANGYVIDCITFYNGKMYIGGNFYSLDTTNISNLAVWDGTTLSPILSNIHGQGAMNSMCIYNDDLYIAGSFETSMGFADNNIMRYDGTNFYDVGGGTDDQIYKIAVFNNELYVAGVFNNAGGQPANKIAKWNGTSWSALSNDVFDNNILDIAFFNGELYAGGGFQTINGDSIGYIAKYTGALGITKENVQPFFNVNLYPNPANENLQLAISSKQQEGEMQIEMTDMLGEKVIAFTEENFTGSFNKQINIANLSSGVYFVKMQVEEGMVVRKFVKE